MIGDMTASEVRAAELDAALEERRSWVAFAKEAWDQIDQAMAEGNFDNMRKQEERFRQFVFLIEESSAIIERLRGTSGASPDERPA